nr:NAD(P)-dependent oxidoreductase [uncultured Oscillibacter sp.]
MRRILLTGAGPHGFIGRNLAPALRERCEVFAPSSRELNLCAYDALARYVDAHRIDTMIHGAVQNITRVGAEDAMLHDMQMFYNVEKLSGQLDKVLYFGSGAEFDKRLPMERIREEELGRSVPADYYGLEKYAMALRARESRNLYNLRLFGIFGRYEEWQSKFISNLCCKAVYDLPLTVRQNCMFDFLYIDDLIPVVIWFLEHTPRYHDYNVCTGQPVDLVSIAKTVLEVSRKQLPIVVAKEGWNTAYTADNSRLSEEMGGVGLHTLENAVGELYKYYWDYRNDIPYDELKDTR